MRDFFPGAQKTTEVDGTSYGVPWYVETRLVYYRTDLAKKAGYTTPPKDWDELKRLAKAMQDKAGAKYGIGLQPGGTGPGRRVMPFAWSNGATHQGRRQAYTFDTPRCSEALTYYQTFFTDGISPTRLPPATPDRAGLRQRQGRRCSSPARGMMSAVEKAGGEGSRTSTPSRRCPPKTDGRTSFVGGSDLAVFKDAKNRDAAWKFVKLPVRPQDAGQVVPAVDRPARGQDRLAGPGAER